MTRGCAGGVAALLGVTLACVGQLCPSTARACSVCGSGDPLVDVASAEPMAGHLALSLGAEYLTATAASDEDPARTEGLRQLTITPAAVYSPTERINLVLRVPVVRKAWRLTGGGDPEESSTRWGLGDVDLGGRWFLWRHTSWEQQSRQNLAVFAGTTLPTGPDGTEVDGERIDQHAQLGAGAFGPYLGVQYAFHRDPWNLFGSVTGEVHTTNAYDYRYAAALLWSVRGGLRPLDWLAFELGLDGRYNGRDVAEGGPQENTGGLVLAVSPGAMFRVVDTLWVHLRVQIPAITALNGEQSVGPVFQGIVQYTFE